MVGSEVKMFSVNDGSLEGNIRILHPVIYFHLCGRFRWDCDVEVNEAH